MRIALLIAWKDLRQRFRDRSVLLFGIVAPLGLAVIFSFVLKPAQESDFKATYVLVDEDGGQIAKDFRGMLDGLEKDDIADVRTADSVAEAEAQVKRGSDEFANEDDGEKADAAFVIPKGLSAGVMGGRGGEITVIGAAGQQLAAQVALSVAQGFAAEIGSVELAVRSAVPGGHEVDPAELGALAQAAATSGSPISLQDVSATTKQLDQTTYTAAGMAVFFLFFTVSFGVSGLLEERRIGTMSRLLAAPVRRTGIVAGKAITSFALGIVSMTVLAVATSLFLDAEWGNPVGVALLIVAAVVAAMGILAVIAAVAKTQDQAGNFQAIVSLILAFLGGTFFSVAQVGGVLAKLSLLTPHAWFLRGLGDLQGGEVSAVLPAVAALLAFGLVTGSIGWVFLMRAVDR